MNRVSSDAYIKMLKHNYLMKMLKNVHIIFIFRVVKRPNLNKNSVSIIPKIVIFTRFTVARVANDTGPEFQRLSGRNKKLYHIFN